MNKIVITSDENKLIKHIKSLQLRKNRNKYNQVIIEGFNIVDECTKIKPELIEYLVFSQKGLYTLNGNEEKYDQFRCYEISDNLFKKIAGTDTPQGILAVIKIPNYNLDALLNIEGGFFIILDRVQDPGNMGTIIRTAVAANATGIILTKGSVDPFNLKTVRSTMGAMFSIPIFQSNENEDAISTLVSKGYKLIATDLNTESTYSNISYKGNIAIIIGNEAQGISQNLLEVANVKVKIPLLGNIESLNAAVSAGILIYKAVEQRTK
ncbi:RNA methyltransferase [Serpentinicella sp. ANB-PHB4]|uniref:TrmH family RNA methyltransferase n=1 Tax=Serpentinicella sp. ANB-PHB4 TaxID=3074076 RepID=UPI00286566F1|nr:RNA methyltransferase [Serpentinicella sp. ANB-PHB4]MDR5659590.1 RNA methyltransferase [Serpentinicella sp. ANB-PHB4]